MYRVGWSSLAPCSLAGRCSRTFRGPADFAGGKLGLHALQIFGKPRVGVGPFSIGVDALAGLIRRRTASHFDRAAIGVFFVAHSEYVVLDGQIMPVEEVLRE